MTYIERYEKRIKELGREILLKDREILALAEELERYREIIKDSIETFRNDDLDYALERLKNFEASK